MIGANPIKYWIYIYCILRKYQLYLYLVIIFLEIFYVMYYKRSVLCKIFKWILLRPNYQLISQIMPWKRHERACWQHVLMHGFAFQGWKRLVIWGIEWRVVEQKSVGPPWHGGKTLGNWQKGGRTCKLLWKIRQRSNKWGTRPKTAPGDYDSSLNSHSQNTSEKWNQTWAAGKVTAQKLSKPLEKATVPLEESMQRSQMELEPESLTEEILLSVIILVNSLSPCSMETSGCVPAIESWCSHG